MDDLEQLRSEIERMRAVMRRKRAEIEQLQRAGIPTADAEAVLEKMQDRVDTLAGARDRLVFEQRRLYVGRDKAIRGPQMRMR